VVGKPLDKIRIVLVGVGAANVATYRLLIAYGVEPKAIIACDTGGILHRSRSDIERQQAQFADKWRICLESNGDNRRGASELAFKDADACIAFSRPEPDVIRPGWIRTMARDPIVFACAKPAPEIWPDAARSAGARIVATGRSDFPNQLNNSLVFPGLFRGVLDVRARTISNNMAIAAAEELVAFARRRGLSADQLLPLMTDWTAAAGVAAAAGAAAVTEGLGAQSIETRATRAAGARCHWPKPRRGGSADRGWPHCPAAVMLPCGFQWASAGFGAAWSISGRPWIHSRSIGARGPRVGATD